MGKIQTGVDRLVALVHEKQKITVDEAAKTLGVSKTIVQEWTEFLEEEGLIDVKYSLSKTYLQERTLSKKDLADKEKQFQTQRETFIRKVDGAVASLDTETASFEAFKKEFSAIKNDLGADLSAMEKEIEQLKSYESLKNSIASDLQKQHELFAKKQAEAEAQLKRQYKQYEDVMHEVASQEKRLLLQKQRVADILHSEEEIGKKVSEYQKLLTELKKRSDDESKEMGLDEEMLNKLHKNAATLKSELEVMQKQTLKPLADLHAQHDVQVRKLEQKVMQKAAEVKSATQKPKQANAQIRKKVEEFFSRKKKIEDLIKQIDKDKLDLAAELKDLQQRAEAFRVGKTAVRMEELESKLKTVEERKKTLRTHLGSFLKLLK